MTKRILLIDSDEAFAQGLSSAMNARGFAATVATNSEHGMTLARQESPDLIVVCVEAQPTNGYMLCTRLKKDEQLKGIPVILTSANATPDSFEKHKKLKTRAEEYLIKPFEPQVMLEKASALLGVSLPPEATTVGDEEIVSIEDEQLALGDLISGEDEPIHLSEHESAQAHNGLEDSVVVEEVEDLTAEPADDSSSEDDLKMFDQAFDSLGGPATAASTYAGEAERFSGLHAVPEPEEAAEHGQEPSQALYDQEHAQSEPTELSAPDDEAVLHGLMHEGPATEADSGAQEDLAGSTYEGDPQAAFEARINELETQLASRDAELENAKRSSASSGETLKLKEAKNRADKELLRLKEQLHAKETELVELQEQQTSLEGQAQQLKDDSVKREAAAKALQQRADALAAAAKKFERELVSAREELKQVAALKGKAADLEKVRAAHDELQKTHAEQLDAARAETDEVKKSQASAQADLAKHGGELTQARGELETARRELEGLRAEMDTLRTDISALTGEKDLLSEEREELRKQVAEAQAQAAQNEDRAVKAYQKIKSDERLREKTRKALQIALQLLEENTLDPEAASDRAEKQSA